MTELDENGRNVMSVTKLNEYVKAIIETDFALSDIYVKGEISNFTNHIKTGHFYFTVKDETSLIRAVMFRAYTGKLKFVPENGMKIIAHGRVSAFVRDGQYQLYCDDMEPDGVGSLYFAYEQLKKKLEAEGLFSQSAKRLLPKIPTRIGIITSPTGAAIRDMINVLGRRFPYAKITLYPALVQGDDAPQSLIDGVRFFNMQNSVDLIIIGRGGGSIEDLWAFNSEALAREIYASHIPLISAVGHETDFTICDFVADRRAPTPSAAAEIAVPETDELMHKINNIIGRMSLLISSRVKSARQTLERFSTAGVLAHPEKMFDERRMILLMLQNRFESAEIAGITACKSRISEISARLDALSPLAVLSRGYGVATDGDGCVIQSISKIKTGDSVSIRVSDGKINATVLSAERIKEARHG